MAAINLKTTFVGNIINIEPNIWSYAGGSFEKNNEVHNNALIRLILMRNKYIDVKSVEDSYKNMIKKIYVNLNKLGFKTNSSNLDDLLIKIVNKNMDMSKIYLEKYSGYILYEMLYWIHTCTYEFDLKCGIEPPQVLSVISTSNYRKGSGQYKISLQFGYSNNKLYLLDCAKYSQKKSADILSNLETDIGNICGVNQIYWFDNQKFKCYFNSRKQMREFDSYANEISLKYLIDAKIRADFIGSWFESKINITYHNNTYSVFSNIQNIDDDRHKLIVSKDQYSQISIVTVLKNLFPKLDKEVILSEVSKYFILEDDQIILDSELIDSSKYVSELINIRIKICELILCLAKLNENK